jgi:oligogalacturonide lyase
MTAAELPTEWVDPDTGHRIVRLSREDGTQSLYFHQNAYTKDGTRIIVTTRGGGISTINLQTREVKQLVPGPVSVMATGHKTGDVYYTKRGERTAGPIVYAANVDTGVSREVVKLPPGRSVANMNADETLLLGSYVDGQETDRRPAARRSEPVRPGELRRRRGGRQANDLRRRQGPSPP